MTIQVKDYGDRFEISWDPEDPIERAFNDWTEEDFKTIIMNAAENVLDGHNFEDTFMAK